MKIEMQNVNALILREKDWSVHFTKRNDDLTKVLRDVLGIEDATVIETNNKVITYAVTGKNKLKHISVSEVIVETMLYLSKINNVKTKFRINHETEGTSYTLRLTTVCRKSLSKVTSNVWLDVVVDGYFTYLSLVKEGKI